jgi:RNA 3'-terminal phosphate cyclase (ATP)
MPESSRRQGKRERVRGGLAGGIRRCGSSMSKREPPVTCKVQCLSLLVQFRGAIRAAELWMQKGRQDPHTVHGQKTARSVRHFVLFQLERRPMLDVDGSRGEGGGQILRTALSLSCVLRVPFRIRNIRSGRRKPGLMPQHLTAVRAAREISGGEVEGDSVGSQELTFRPRRTVSGDYRFDIGTAGAVSLVLQTLLLPLALAGGKSTVSIRGGTHLPHSPPWHYLERVFAPFLASIGVRVSLSLESCGFYPAGGGRVSATIHPAEAIRPVEAAERGPCRPFTALSGVANLPFDIARRQLEGAAELLGGEVALEPELRELDSPVRGTFILLYRPSGRSGFSAVGERGKRAEAVGREAAEGLLRYCRSDAAFDPYLADQTVPYASLASGVSRFTTSLVTRHLLTNLDVVRLFTGAEWSVDGREGEAGAVTITPSTSSRTHPHP